MNKKVFSLVVQDNYLKVLTLKKNKVKSFGLTKLSPGAVSNDKVIRLQRVADELSNLLKSAQPRKIKSKEVVLEISDAHSFIKKVHFPGIKKEEIPNVLKWQLEKILPTPENNAYWDYQIIQETKEGVDVLIVAVLKEAVDPMINALEILGLNIVGIEPRSVALSKILATENKPILIINIGMEKLTCLVGKNKIPFLSTIELLEAKPERLKETIKQTINFYQKENNEEIKDVLICGDQKIEEIYSLIKTNFKNLKVEKADLEIKSPSIFKNQASKFISNIGLLIQKPAFNLLPPHLQEEARIISINNVINRLILYLTLFVLTIIVLSLGVWLHLEWNLKNTQKAIEDINKNQTDIDLTELENEAKETNQRANKINQLFTLPSNQLNTLLLEIKKAAPANLKIDFISFDFNKKSGEVRGIAQFREQIILFKNNLEKINQIENVKLPLSNLEKPSEINFTLIYQLKD